MSENLYGIGFIVAIFVGYAVVVGWLDRRTPRIERRRIGLEARTTSDLPAATDAYLRSLRAALDMPADLRAEITAEVAGHLADSTAALELEGLTPDAAGPWRVARAARF